MLPSTEKGLPLPGLRWRGLTLRMFLFIFLPLTVILLAVVLTSQTLHHNAMRALVGDRDLRAVRASANSLQLLIQQRADRLSTVKSPSSDALADFFAANTDLFDGGWMLLSARGDVLASGGTLAVPAPQITAQISGEGLLTLPAGQAGGDSLAGIVQPLPDGRRLVALFRVQPLLQTALSGVLVPGQSSVRLLDAQQNTLFQSGSLSAAEDANSHTHLANPPVGESGIDYFESSHGEHVAAFSPVGSTGWSLILEETWEDISSPTLLYTQLAPLALVPVLLITLAALWYGAQNIVRPLQKLEEQAAQLAAGDFHSLAPSVGGIDEIRRLQGTLVAMAADLESAQASLRGYIGAITAGVENERRSLARELHDDTLQGLIVLNQRVQMAALNAHDETEHQAFTDLQELIQSAITNLRRMVRGLRPIYLEDLGLSAALGSLAEETSRLSGLPVNFTVQGTERRLPPDAELAFYRIAQEALSNTLRHSGAQHAGLELVFSPADTILVIHDDGRGFVVPESPSQFAPQGHFGLVGMHERAELIGATLRIQSSPRGTRVTLSLPG